ncbi:MAG: DUF3578 domain-containing protein [Tannerella sp.]|jgi:5-methylcytosine-specific restriction protein B|nr:DUF3578 domain-containing protein [Tannerella sp.]
MKESDKSESFRDELSHISKDDVIKIIHDIDKNGLPPRIRSTKYDLVYEGQSYPAKYVLSLAYNNVTRKTMTYGGHDDIGREHLKGLGFTVETKQKPSPSFYPVIQKFIRQANEDKSIKVAGYPKEYKGLKVEVSFGKGNHARIPWISFLYEGQSTSNGIYPVFLYYRELKMLILSFGVSETHKPSKHWDLSKDIQSIESYFFDNKLGAPKRYGNSYVFRVYSPTSEIEPSNLDEDLNQMISIYKKMMAPIESKDTVQSPLDVPFNIHRIAEIRKTGLLFSKDLLYRYTVSLLTKPFVILSGLSGSGKTRLALTFAKWLSENESQVKVVSVGADWNNREYLLGCPNALDPGAYIQPENEVLNFVVRATKNPSRPYFLILDEMNLSYVERYFADFLSTMESFESITLHPDTTEWSNCEIPPEIKLPPNLYITGTINVDETTYMFSPKVLDRANVIEFRVNEDEMNEYLLRCEPIKRDAINYTGADMADSFIRLSQESDFNSDKQLNTILMSFFTALKQAGAEFGYRTVSEMYRFISLARKLNTGWNNDKLMDIVVMQKMLPKLHGSRKKIQPILNTLWRICLQPDAGQLLIENEEVAIDQRFRYPLSATKVRQMFRNAKDNGFTSYAEA